MANKTKLFHAPALAGLAALVLLPAVGSAQTLQPRPWQRGYDSAAAPRPDFPGAKDFDPASPAFLGAGNSRSAAQGMGAPGAPSKEELARHKAYVESLRQQQGYK
jgi:hypothetical protein